MRYVIYGAGAIGGVIGGRLALAGNDVVLVARGAHLAALRSDLLQGGMVDSYEAAELLRVFLMGRGYGVSPSAALDAAGRVEMAGCALPVLQHELENLAMVM